MHDRARNRQPHAWPGGLESDGERGVKEGEVCRFLGGAVRTRVRPAGGANRAVSLT